MVIFSKINFVVIVVLFLGIILNILPFSDNINSIKPPILLLILIYWSLAFPNQINLTYAFISGLIMDVLLIMPLSYNALCYTVTIFLILLYRCMVVRVSSYNISKARKSYPNIFKVYTKI